MSNEANMEIANDVLNQFIWVHKAIGLSGLAKYAQMDKSELRIIQYKDVNNLSKAKVNKLIQGLGKLRDYINNEYDVMVDKLGKAVYEKED